MTFTPFFVFVLPVIMILAVAITGSTRRLGFWLALILSIALTPVWGFILVVLSGPRRRKVRPALRSPRR